MNNFNANNLINILKDKKINKYKIAKTNDIILQELDNNLNDTCNMIKNLTIEKSIKFLLWNGIVNNYGIYGKYKEQSRSFGVKPNKKVYNDKSYSRGKVLSIDFGTSNLGREFSYTHSGIVIADYTGIIIVIPITSQKEYGLSKLPRDIQDVTLSLLNKDYPEIKEDSYVLINQIRAVSKNRVTKIITSLGKTKMMEEIEEKLFQTQTPYMRKVQNDKILELEKKIKELENTIDKFH